MRLYGVRGWGSAIAEALLVEAAIPYDFIDVTGFDRPGPARDTLQRHNPLAQVPTLVLPDGEVLTETAAIALYLADAAPSLAPPPGHTLRPRFLRLLVWLVANVYPSFTYGDYPDRWAPSSPQELIASTNEARENLWLWLEQQAGAPWLLGARFTALDIYLAVMTTWRPRAPWFAAHAPRLAAIAAAARARPSLAAVLAANATPEDVQ